jgi:glutathionylspermidine synthase
VRTVAPTLDYHKYAAAWDGISRAGDRHFNIDTWAGGHRYVSLTAVVLTATELAELKALVPRFSRLLSLAVDGILADTDWWANLAWPWPAIELARQEPTHPGREASLYGRFDCLLDADGIWQVIESNADTPSGGREVSGLEPALARLHPGLRPIGCRLAKRLTNTLITRIKAHQRPVRSVGVIANHSWLEDLAQATWLGALLSRAGQPTIVGDVTDLVVQRGRTMLRGRPIDALYRFYPIELLYRHSIFASLCELSIDGRLLLLNGLRGFLAQSKACLAWLWSNRSTLGTEAHRAIERHVPPTLVARDPAAAGILPGSIVKHVNGREGDSVVFGNELNSVGWEARLLEPGYVVQQTVSSPAVEDVEVDDWHARVRCVGQRVACVGAFAVGGRFAGCYTRLDGRITSPRATYSVTLREPT